MRELRRPAGGETERGVIDEQQGEPSMPEILVGRWVYDTDDESHQQMLADIAREEADQAAFTEAVRLLVEAATPLAHIGDGEGGACLNQVMEAFDEAFGSPRREATKNHAKRPRRPTPAHKLIHTLSDRDGWLCSYCSKDTGCACRLVDQPDLRTAVADHVIPKSRGGVDDATNRVIACGPCNTSKGDRTPSEWGRE